MGRVLTFREGLSGGHTARSAPKIAHDRRRRAWPLKAHGDAEKMGPTLVRRARAGYDLCALAAECGELERHPTTRDALQVSEDPPVGASLAK
eukprot:1432431-Alexandrium_andersonii.AAC.1